MSGTWRVIAWDDGTPIGGPSQDDYWIKLDPTHRWDVHVYGPNDEWCGSFNTVEDAEAWVAGQSSPDEFEVTKRRPHKRAR